jgi:hypothetical protein
LYQQRYLHHQWERYGPGRKAASPQDENAAARGRTGDLFARHSFNVKATVGAAGRGLRARSAEGRTESFHLGFGGGGGAGGGMSSGPRGASGRSGASGRPVFLLPLSIGSVRPRGGLR